MPTEEQLLNTIFDAGTALEAREKAIGTLKKITGKDRGDLVDRYTKNANGGGFAGFSFNIFTGSEAWKMAQDRCAVLERELAEERQKLRSKEELVLALTSANSSQAEMIRKLQDAYSVIDPEIPGTVESIAPRNFRLDKKVRAILPMEEVCPAYGLVLVPSSALPDIPLGYPYWRPKRGKVFTTKCPICGGVLWVNTHYQRWTDLRCDFRFSNRKRYAPDVMGLVEHLTGCSYYNALWYVIGTGSQPQRKDPEGPKEPSAPRPDKPKTRRPRKAPIRTGAATANHEAAPESRVAL
jgi:hypothetical protein